MQYSDQEWLALVRTPGVGNRTLLPLIRQCASFGELVSQAPPAIADKINASLHHPDTQQQELDQRWLEDPCHHLLTLNDQHYPAMLAETDDPPIVLFVSGNIDVLTMPQLAIVGSRNPSKTGLDNAFAFSRYLADAGLVITSGMALGIDGQAHAGCLSAGGSTIAVTGTGPDRVYPARHHKLAHEIVENGAIVSEFPPGTEPKPGNFPRRNRIISGLSLGTLVVEATIKSGSLITAKHALEQGREVFAIPGSIHNPQSKGCHKLIKEGAKLVEQAQDIVEELKSLFSVFEVETSGGEISDSSDKILLDDDYQLLLEKMGWDPVTAEQLVEATAFPAESVSSMLLLLELQGHVSSAPGGYFSRTNPPS